GLVALRVGGVGEPLAAHRLRAAAEVELSLARCPDVPDPAALGVEAADPDLTVEHDEPDAYPGGLAGFPAEVRQHESRSRGLAHRILLAPRSAVRVARRGTAWL